MMAVLHSLWCLVLHLDTWHWLLAFHMPEGLIKAAIIPYLPYLKIMWSPPDKLEQMLLWEWVGKWGLTSSQKKSFLKLPNDHLTFILPPETRNSVSPRQLTCFSGFCKWPVSGSGQSNYLLLFSKCWPLLTLPTLVGDHQSLSICGYLFKSPGNGLL